MFFKKKPNDDQVEITALLLATGLYESGETVNSVGLADLITSSMKKVYSTQDLKPDATQSKVTQIAVFALFAEGTLVKEFSAFRNSNPGAPISRDVSLRIKQICADFTQFSMKQK